MSTSTRWRLPFALLSALVLALAVAACGDDSNDSSSADGTTADSGGDLIQENPDNNGVKLTIGSKNFTEQFILGEIRGYPEYTSTALQSFFKTAPEDVPSDAQEAADQVQPDLQKLGLVGFAPTPFADANALGTLTSTAEDLGVTKISDLEGKSQDLTLAGSPECRQRTDCLVGLQDTYGLDFKAFKPVDIGLRYEELDNGDADLSILFTSDAQLFVDSDKYTLLEDDKGIFPAGNVIFISDQKAADEAGPDYQATIEKVQEGLTLEVMQELNARVDVDKQKPEDVAHEYLQEAGYIE
jgi:glycine betaine/choline ABC-type transport system substrate-binding protein